MRKRVHSPDPSVRAGIIALMACSLALGLTLSGCGGGDGARADGEGEPEVPRNVRVMTVAEADLQEYLILSGPTFPLHGTELSAEEGGRVESIKKDKGAIVNTGDVLILQDRRLLKADMDAQAAARDLSAFNLDRMRQLYEANAISEIEFLDAETQHRQTEAMAEAARIRYDRAAIKAPFHGVVTDRYVEPGQSVVPGMPVARLVDPFVLKLSGGVTEREVASLEPGMRAEVLFDGVAERVEGSVQWVGFEADPLTGKFPVEIWIENEDLALNPGVVARARIAKVLHAGVISIPRDAVVQKGNGPVAFVIEGDRARMRALKLGSDQGLMVIVEQGLSPGDRLVVRGQRDIQDGALVSVQEETQALDGTTAQDPAVVSQGNALGDEWSNESADTGDKR